MPKRRLRARERELVQAGFRQSYTPSVDPDVLRDIPVVTHATQRLAHLNQGDRVKPRRVAVKRQAPPLLPALTEAALIRALQQRGIGRPSTFAEVVEILVKRRYVQREAGSGLAVTELGQQVYEFLVSCFPQVFDLAFTARLEAELDAIAMGRMGYQAVCARQWELIRAAAGEMGDGTQPSGLQEDT